MVKSDCNKLSNCSILNDLASDCQESLRMDGSEKASPEHLPNAKDQMIPGTAVARPTECDADALARVLSQDKVSRENLPDRAGSAAR